MKKRHKKPLYIVYIIHKETGELFRVIEHRDYEKALLDNDFYNNTDNLKSEIKTIFA